ncbi:MAG: thiol-disulfide oxidoreductase DCC family protein [Sphingobacteriaceae bacterium]
MKQTLVFYDGSCRMCMGVSGWLSRIDGKQQFRLVPFQNTELLAQYPQIKPEDCEKEIHIINQHGKVLRGADAVMEIWRKTGHWSAFLANIFRLPPFIWVARTIYGLIARFRSVY